MIRLVMMLAAAVAISTAGGTAHAKMAMQTFPVLAGAGPHDVYPAPDGAVWFTAQSAGKLGRLDPKTGKSDLIALGPGAAPHGVIVGPDGAAWITEGGQNATATPPCRPARKPRSALVPAALGAERALRAVCDNVILRPSPVVRPRAAPTVRRCRRRAKGGDLSALLAEPRTRAPSHYSAFSTKSLSAPDSAPQTSPLRPASCRTPA